MKTVVNIKVDKDVKVRAQNLARDLGLSLSTVLNAYLRQFVRDERVTFSTVPAMTPELERLLSPIDTDIKKKRNISKAVSTKEDIGKFFEAL